MSTPAPLIQKSRFDRWGLALLAAGALLPLLWCQADFRALFWFGDEWDQLDQIATHGFGRWMFGFFGENFAPIFKLVWGSVALGSGGSYFALIVTAWLAHAIAVGLFGRWLRIAGFGGTGTAVAMIGFGYTTINVETLGWAVQLITILGMLFFLAAGAWQQSRGPEGSWSNRALLGLALLAALSSFSFVRGALTGLALVSATASAAWEQRHRTRDWTTRGKVAVACLLPGLISAALIAKYAGGNHQHLAAAGWRPPVEYAAWYFLLNPVHRFLDVSTWGPHTTFVLGLGKIALLVAGWRLATIAQRRLLVPLLVFDLGNAALLGLGRHHTGLLTTTGSRYQYVALIATLPFVAVLIDAAIARVKANRPLTALIVAGATCGVSWLALAGWPATMKSWADWRGRQGRQILLKDANPPATGAVPGIDFIPTAKARELIERYHLH
jgi:hypothetical protein